MVERKESKSPLNITIVGAGLAGLSAAIFCSLAGHNVLVTESAKELAEVC
jgi:salicylate hydroxylase